MLLGHLVDEAEQVLFLDLPRFLLSLLAELRHTELSIPFFAERRTLLIELVLLGWFHCLEAVHGHVEGLVLVFSVSHLDSLWRPLEQFVQIGDLPCTATVSSTEGPQWLQVGRVLDDCRPIGVSTRGVHGLVILCSLISPLQHVGI